MQHLHEYLRKPKYEDILQSRKEKQKLKDTCEIIN